MRMRREANRRERNDIRRGYWETTEPLTRDEEYALRRLKDFDQWEEFTDDDGRTDWRLKESDVQPRYDELSRKDQEYKHIVNYVETRQPPEKKL